MGIVLGFGQWTVPEDGATSWCLTRRVLGLPCPGCGLTRALAHLVQGSLQRALAVHPLAPLVVLDAAAAWGLWGLVVHDLAAPPAGRTVRVVLLAQLALFVALWLGRLATGTAPF